MTDRSAGELSDLMKLEKLLLSALLVLSISTAFFMKRQETRIEIYLIDQEKNTDTPDYQPGYFLPKLHDLSALPFIADKEICSYEVVEDPSKNPREVKYFLHISENGREKIKQLGNISVSRGQRFAIAVNRELVYGGYFWNPVSSFSCDWIVVSGWQSGKMELRKGYPGSHFASAHSDPRASELLIQAFAHTHRLIRSQH